MNFESLKFRHPWRPYQQRVLDAIEQHLEDKRLHVVAAPGAGKTTLGLEVFRRLGRSTLVLSPTRVIRDQWIDRLQDFCEGDNVSQLDWVSKHINQPGVLTSITYQALHAQFKDELDNESEEDVEALEEDEGVTEEELNTFISTLQLHAIKVIILDEAHHLRAEWWRALDKVCTALPDIVIVSLTATPPYDAQDHEWIRYEQLCGPIDEEISVPELVKAGTLCPHQDFIWAANATTKEKERIQEYDDRVIALCHTLITNEQFKALVLTHPWLKVPHDDAIENEIIKQPKIAIAILSFIKSLQIPIAKELLSILDLSVQDIPDLSRRWWQVLIETLLFSKTCKHNDDDQNFIDQLKKQLRTSELLHKRELSLERSRRMERSLSLSISKIDSCVTIHKLEYRYRGDSLSQVVLTDYIRDEALKSNLNTGEINMGAWPIFKAITSASPIANQVALLTGRLSIIPTEHLDALFEYIDVNKFKAEPLGNEAQYQKLTGPLNQLTKAFTALFMKGLIKTLVGTRSLLGEGWDAPAINSLVLASSVGSFMLTNQMRGRAIRIDKAIPDKVSSIWHLVAINTNTYTGWSDFYSLKQRFNTFVGLSAKHKTIESGFDRMDAKVLDPVYNNSDKNSIGRTNRLMIRRYRNLGTLFKRWRDALTLDEAARIVPSVKTPGAPLIRSYFLKHTFAYLLIQITGVVSSVVIYTLSANPRFSKEGLLLLLIAMVGALLYMLPQTLTALRILFRHLPVAGSLKHIGKALMMALCQCGMIETSFRRIKVNVNKDVDGSYYLSISGCSFYESSLFADCLTEILSPIESPRYLVLRQGTFLGMTRDDYHAVPMRFGIKKDLARIFYKSWCKYVGPSELIYTRSSEGRASLLKAKMKAFSSAFENKIKRQDRWQ